MTSLTSRERHFLSLLYPEGTISVGTTIGHNLFERGLVRIAKFGRYGITPAGIAALRARNSGQGTHVTHKGTHYGTQRQFGARKPT